MDAGGEVAEEDGFRVAPVEVVIDVEGNNPMEGPPPCKEVVEQLVIAEDIIDRASSRSGGLSSDRSQDSGLRVDGGSIGWSGVPGDLVEEDEVEMLAMPESPLPICDRAGSETIVEAEICCGVES